MRAGGERYLGSAALSGGDCWQRLARRLEADCVDAIDGWKEIAEGILAGLGQCCTVLDNPKTGRTHVRLLHNGELRRSTRLPTCVGVLCHCRSGRQQAPRYHSSSRCDGIVAAAVITLRHLAPPPPPVVADAVTLRDP